MNRILTKHYEYGEEEMHYLKRVDPVLGAGIPHMDQWRRSIYG